MGPNTTFIASASPYELVDFFEPHAGIKQQLKDHKPGVFRKQLSIRVVLV